MHTLNLEQLAVLVRELNLGGERWAAPDMMIGTDSHTPMIKRHRRAGLGRGRAGSADGHVRHAHHAAHSRRDRRGTTGALPPGALATDLALTVTQRLRRSACPASSWNSSAPASPHCPPAAGPWCNMAPVRAPTTAPPDERTLDYLRQTGRSADALDLARAYLRRSGLWFDPQARPATRAPSPSRWTSPATRPARAGRKTCRWRACPPRAGCERPAPRLGGRPARLSRGHRRDHQLHQHLGPGAADRGPACWRARRAHATGRRAPGSRPRWGGLARRRQLPAPRRADGRSVRHRLRHRGLRLHHLHRQFRSAARPRGGPRRLARSGPWPSCRATGTSPAACIRIWSWGSWCRRHL